MTQRFTQSLLAVAVAGGLATSAQAADELNVAYFLEWATPNMVAKADGAYEDALGIPVNWTAFDTGVQMTEAMLAGDIDISYSQGLAPFINAVNGNAPIVLAAIAVQYPANDCVVKSDAGIDKDNASELEGQAVAVPLATMADYSFRMQMREFGVDVSKIEVVDQAPPDGAVALADGNVVMACVFGGDSTAKALEVGESLMTTEEKEAAGIVSFDVVSVTESFAQEEPDLVRAFLEVTSQANADYTGSDEQLEKMASESGMSVDAVKSQMETFVFPTSEEQLNEYFNEDGVASAAIKVVGDAFATDENPARDDYAETIDTSFME